MRMVVCGLTLVLCIVAAMGYVFSAYSGSTLMSVYSVEAKETAKGKD